jgi:hypothetical protein
MGTLLLSTNMYSSRQLFSGSRCCATEEPAIFRGAVVEINGKGGLMIITYSDADPASLVR